MRHSWVRASLAAFIFAQYFALGVWFVALGPYMSTSLHMDSAIGIAYATQGLAAILSTMIAGVIADRFMAPRALISLLLAISAASLVTLSLVRSNESAFLGLILVHFLAFIPTIPLSNAICLRSLENPDAEFARIRVFGTLGWIAGGIIIGAIPGGLVSPLPMQIAAGTMIVMSIAGRALPAHSAPDSAGDVSLASLLGIDALQTIRSKPFWFVAFIAAVSSIPLAFYNAYCATFLQDLGIAVTIAGHRFEPTAIQSLGQISELAFLLSLPFALRKVGIRGILLLGLCGWLVRSGCFILASAPTSILSSNALVISGILLHGMCYDFMLIGAALFVDQCVAAQLRARAQAFLTLVTMGIGISIGSLFANWVYGATMQYPAQHNWPMLWATVAGFAAIALVVLIANFRAMGREQA